MRLVHCRQRDTDTQQSLIATQGLVLHSIRSMPAEADETLIAWSAQTGQTKGDFTGLPALRTFGVCRIDGKGKNGAQLEDYCRCVIAGYFVSPLTGEYLQDHRA